MIKHFSGVQIDEAEPEFFGAAAETVNEAGTVELKVSAGTGILIGELAAQHTIDQYREVCVLSR